MWKNHFYEMKGDVGMSSHEKEREQEGDTNSFITPSLYLCSALKFCLFGMTQVTYYIHYYVRNNLRFLGILFSIN